VVQELEGYLSVQLSKGEGLPSLRFKDDLKILALSAKGEKNHTRGRNRGDGKKKKVRKRGPKGGFENSCYMCGLKGGG